MKNLLYHMPRPDYVLAMAPTEDTFIVLNLSPRELHRPLFSEKLERTVTLQRSSSTAGKRTVLIILDDCLYQMGF